MGDRKWEFRKFVYGDAEIASALLLWCALDARISKFLGCSAQENILRVFKVLT